MTPAQYIAAVREPLRKDVAQLHALIRRAAPSFAPYVTGRMIGYGKYHYRYATGREGDACRVGLAAGKSGISLYVLAVDNRGYLAEQAGATLGKVSVGKSCIRIKRYSDVNIPALTMLLEKAARLPGPAEVTATAKKPSAKKKTTTAAKKKTSAKKKKTSAKKTR